ADSSDRPLRLPCTPSARGLLEGPTRPSAKANPDALVPGLPEARPSHHRGRADEPRFAFLQEGVRGRVMPDLADSGPEKSRLQARAEFSRTHRRDPLRSACPRFQVRFPAL